MDVPLDRRPSQRVVVATLFVATMFITIMDTTIVNVALPSIAADLGVSSGSIDEVVIAYLVSLAVSIPASGWLADRFGSRPVFLAALGVFTAASALCGLAGSLTALVVFRVLQGVGGGLLTPVGMAMLYRVYPPAERARAARILIVPTVVAPAAGPILGGVLTDQASWHWVFLVNVPIGIAAFGFGLAFLTGSRVPGAGRFDALGFVLSASGFALVLYALSVGPNHGWRSAGTLTAAGVGLLATGATVWWELRRTQPLLALRLLGNDLFRTVSLTLSIAFMAFMGVLFLVPLLMQTVRSASSPPRSGSRWSPPRSAWRDPPPQSPAAGRSSATPAPSGGRSPSPRRPSYSGTVGMTRVEVPGPVLTVTSTGLALGVRTSAAPPETRTPMRWPAAKRWWTGRMPISKAGGSPAVTGVGEDAVLAQEQRPGAAVGGRA